MFVINDFQEDWVDKLDEAPAEFPKRLIFIYELVTNVAVKANLENAIKAYIEIEKKKIEEMAPPPLALNLTKSAYFGGSGEFSWNFLKSIICMLNLILGGGEFDDTNYVVTTGKPMSGYMIGWGGTNHFHYINTYC